MVAKVLIDTTVKMLNKVYDYKVPEDLEYMAEIGKRVYVNFGQGRGTEAEGIIVKLEDEKDSTKKKVTYKLKNIISILDNESYLDDSKLKLAKWMGKMYFCNVYDCLKLMLPPGTRGLDSKKELKGKEEIVVSLLKANFEIEKDIESGKISSARHIKLLRFLTDNDYVVIEDLIEGLGISRAIIKLVEKNKYIKIEKREIPEIEKIEMIKSKKLEATSEQKIIIKDITNKIKNGEFNINLIHGITGSGKTEVYLQIIESCIKNGKNSIVLVPEIALTYQIKSRFLSRFGDVVSVLHSKMTITEKKIEWKRIKDGKVKIVIGPRSALFVPLPDLDLIIIDEEHDPSYNSAMTPKYITREVAEYIARTNDITLILGSATPEISTMYRAKELKEIDYYRLNNRPGKASNPDIKIVDMKIENLIGNKLISSKLKEAIEKNIAKKEQTFIFINRRGFSTTLMCKSCGQTLKCKNCDVNLTYHKKSSLLLCHYCSYAERNLNSCPMCGNINIAETGTGTQKIQEKLSNMFPEARIMRMDMDTTIKKGAHEKILNKFNNKEADILIGTQMISKGHDIENVTLVGVINADSTFAGNDYMSTQRGFQNLLQVAGRSGRGSLKGEVIVQAYDLESYAIKSLENNSYDEFYQKEIEARKIANYPPFIDILLIELSYIDKKILMEESKKLYDILNSKKTNNYKVYSPKTPFIQRVNNKYKIQIILKTKINTENLDLVYENIKKYDKINRQKVSVVITKNPTYIG